MSRPVVKELFGNLGEEQILSMAKNTAKNALLKTVRLVSDQQRQTQEEKKGNKNLDMNSFLSWLENQMNNYAIELRHIISKEEDKDGWNRHLSNNTRDNDRTSHLRRYHKYVLKHDIGSNYSLYFKTLLESIFNEKLQKHISIKTASSMLTFEFQE
jgi:outer membrane receptor for ferrienterochelin and colicin